MLGNHAIIQARKRGHIVIEPFDMAQLGENSYDVRLSDKLLLNTRWHIDPKYECPYTEITIPEEGFELSPGRLYLGATIEIAGTVRKYVPMLEGRSSFARLGLVPHLAAGFGDVGFCRPWTLELMAMDRPVKVYPGMRIAQVYFDRVEGHRGRSYKDRGTYSGQTGPQPSMWWKHQDKKA